MMLLLFSQRGKTACRGENSTTWNAGPLCRAGVLVCVLLVILTGFVTVVHFHAKDSAGSDHSCALCALAHTGVASNTIAPPAPLFVPSTLVEIPASIPYSSLAVFSYHIRPPPA